VIVAVVLFCASRRAAPVRVAGAFANLAEGGEVEKGENGQPIVPDTKGAFKQLDPDGNGIVTEESPAGAPPKEVNYDTFKAEIDAEKKEVAEENGDTDQHESAVYFRFMAGAGFADKETLDAGEMVWKAEYRPLPPDRMPVKELYTFGAPATSWAGLFNAQTESGCIPGIRVVTQKPIWMPAQQSLMLESDPVPSLLDFGFKHALMDFMPASTVNVRVDPIRECEYFRQHPHRLKDSPKWDNMWWINGHMIYPGVMVAHLDKYPASPYRDISANDLALLGGATEARRLQDSKEYIAMTTEEKVEKTTVIARLAFANYGPPLQAALIEEAMGWILVGAANAATDAGAASGLLGYSGDVRDAGGYGVHSMWKTVNTFSDGFGDHMMLFQHKDSLDCAMVFEGSGLVDLKDWLANLNFFVTEFCGFGPTHKGFRAKVLRMVGGIDYNQVIRRKLPSCSSITVGGHSLGGAQAELFTACANFPRNVGEPGFLDHRLMQIPRGEPKKMKHFFSDHAKGSYLRNKGNKLCLDVQGTMSTTYRQQVIMYNCELPDSPYGKDQKWRFHPDGFIVSELSGKCIDGNETTGEARVAQWTCEFHEADTDQKWDHTPEGFLRNRKTGKCIDDEMKMYECPFTDQVWHLTDAGLLVNKISGMCMNVKPAPPGLAPGAGSLLYLGECEHDKPGTWHQWEFTGQRLRNKNNGLCAVEKLDPGSISTPEVVLGECKQGDANDHGQYVDRWQLSPSGFITNGFTNRCIDVPGKPGKEMWTHLTVNKCEDKGISTSGLWRKDSRGFILNSGSDVNKQSKCIEIFAEPNNATQEFADGQELWLDYCKLNSDQKWVVREDGKIKNVIGGEKCLSRMHDLKLTTAASAPLFWIDNCAEVDDPALFMTFKWSLQPDGHLINKFSSRCMTYLTHYEPDHPAMLGLGLDEFEVVARRCDEAPHGVDWSLLQDGSIQNTETGKCLDVGTPNVQGLVPVILRPCDESRPGQKWKLIDFGILMNVELGRCVEQKYDPNSVTQINGSHVYRQDLRLLAEPCPANNEMLWEQLPTGQIKNQASGKCLDAPHPGQNFPDGTPLQPYTLTEWECDTTRATQQWEQIEAPLVIL